MKTLIRSVVRLPGIRHLLFVRYVRGLLQRLPGAHLVYGRGWELLHPFDSGHGIDTSGYLPSEDLPGSAHGTTKRHVYGGSQPSIIRAALKSLPALDSFTFVDLGCGKARPLIVASEFPFRAAIGVELSEPLVKIAQSNLDVIRARDPNRCTLQVVTGDAATFVFPDGDLCVFLYNPFGAEVMTRVVANLEQTLATAARRVFVVYYNPLHGVCWDASPAFSRYFAATFPYAAEERGFGPDEADPVVIWQAGKNPLPPHVNADAPICVIKEDYRCGLAG